MRCAGRLTLLTMTGKGRHRHKVGVGGRNIKLKGGREPQRSRWGSTPAGASCSRRRTRWRVRMAITQGKRSVLNRQYTLRQPRPRHKAKGKKPTHT